MMGSAGVSVRFCRVSGIASARSPTAKPQASMGQRRLEEKRTHWTPKRIPETEALCPRAARRRYAGLPPSWTAGWSLSANSKMRVLTLYRAKARFLGGHRPKLGELTQLVLGVPVAQMFSVLILRPCPAADLGV